MQNQAEKRCKKQGKYTALAGEVGEGQILVMGLTEGV